MDHNVPTTAGPVTDPISARQMEALQINADEFGITMYPWGSGGQGIVHVIGPEMGYTQPGMTIVCGDSHTSTHGAFGALAFGIGTSEVEHVLATQTLPAVQAEVDGGHGRRRPSAQLQREGHHPGDHQSDRHRRRRRSRDRVPRRGDPGALDGGPHDDLQHVDRSRRPRRRGRARRDDLRLRRRAARTRPPAPNGSARSTSGARCRPTPAPSSTPRSRSTPRRCSRT